jgi:hypothetical protein
MVKPPTSGNNSFPNIMRVNFTACDTQTIGPHVCTPGAPGCGTKQGSVGAEPGGEETPMQGSVRSLARYILQVPIERRKPHGIYGAGTTGAADGCEPKGGAETRRGCWGSAGLSVVTKENITTPL